MLFPQCSVRRMTTDALHVCVGTHFPPPFHDLVGAYEERNFSY